LYNLAKGYRMPISRRILGWLADRLLGAIAWPADNGHRPDAPASASVDRSADDRDTKAMIAHWAARKAECRPAAEPAAEGPDHV
jgi:hypothetical protein